MSDDDDGEIEFVFMGPGECELCKSMVGTVSDSPIEPLHPNCNCKSVPRTKCNNQYRSNWRTTRYGPGGNCYRVDAEIAVICHDGTLIGESREIDMGCEDSGDELADLEMAIGEFASGLEAGCPDCPPPLVS